MLRASTHPRHGFPASEMGGAYISHLPAGVGEVLEKGCRLVRVAQEGTLGAAVAGQWKTWLDVSKRLMVPRRSPAGHGQWDGKAVTKQTRRQGRPCKAGHRREHSTTLVSSPYPRSREGVKKSKMPLLRATWTASILLAGGVGRTAELQTRLKASDKQDWVLGAEWDQLIQSDWKLRESSWDIAQEDTTQWETVSQQILGVEAP